MRIPFFVVAALLLANPADAAYFGKNKVQYKDFHWRVLETPHFAIHFYDREAPLVEDAARLAERSYDRLSATLQHEFSRRIPVILYASHSEFQQTNITESFIDAGTGGVTDIMRRRVFLPFTGSWGELEHVLTHELVHAFELDMLYDPKPSGDKVNPMAFSPPLWVMEGLAEYLSRSSPDPHTEMWVRDACLSGTLPSIETLAWVRDIRVYRLGQSIWTYFCAEYGDQQIGPLFQAMRKHKSFEKAMEEITGASLSDFSDRWQTTMRRRHLPAIAAHEVAREFSTPVLTRRGERTSLLLGPALSPDGKRLAYVSDRSLSHELWVRDLDGAPNDRCLVEGGTSSDFETLRFFSASTAWSPDGRVIAFPAQSRGEDALYLLDTRSGEVVRRLAFGLDEVQTATFSPDGEELVFVGLLAGQSDLYRARCDGTGLRRLTDDRHTERDPQWSPDGRSIVYVTDEGPETDLQALRFGRMHLALLDLESGERRDITPFATGKAVSPAWSGDGEFVAFVSDRDGVSNIYALHLPTGQVFRVTDAITGISGILPTSPALTWARTSRRLVFTVFGESGWDVYRIEDPLAAFEPVEVEPGEIVALAPPPTAATFELAALDPGAVTSAADGGAATDSVPQAAEFRIRDYKAKLSPDLSSLGGVVGYDAGIAGQSRLQFTDLLGNHTLTVGLGIYGSIKESDLYLSWLDRSTRLNYSVSAFQFRRRYGVIGRGAGVSTAPQTYRGVQIAALRPFDKFSRVEASLRVAGVEGRFFLGETAAEAESDPGIESMRTFLGPGLAYVHDSALWGYTGPIKGRRMRVSLEGGIGQLQYATLETDLRQYWNLQRSYTVAARFFGTTSHGSSPQTVYLGGAQSLRGYDYGSLIGNHALLASVEFRFPMLRHLGLGWPLPLEFGQVQGVLFADAATAWDREIFRTTRALEGLSTGRRGLVSGGLGVRVNLGAMVLKVDWAQLYDTGTGRRSAGSSVALGTDF